MRKLALLLGSLVVVASASAKEVVPAPVVVEEAPVQIVEKEVIVYKEKEEGFRPNGYVDLQYRYYGRTEKNNGESEKDWNSKNNYSRTQLQGKVQMTENQALDFRVRDFNDLDHEPGLQAGNGLKTQVRLRYYYDHGTLGDSKIGATSMVRYEKGSSQTLEYRYDLQFADYFFNNDFIKTTNFVVGPRYMYNWGSNNDNYTHTLGLYMDIINEHPWGFWTEIEIDGLHYNMYGDAARPVDGKADNYKDNSFDVSVAATLHHEANLYTNGKYSLDWAFEGGYDAYQWHNIDRVETTAGNYIDDEYELYAQPSVTLSYQATEFVSLYATAGAEYRNWRITAGSEASNWRWQPFGIVGFKTTF
ncbi:TonB-dependent receptor [uncultured Fusobacterium sp.]|uniref:major outer membrane protein FomA n=1 Tax=uncultured Fusobacterium sp. TaxID=159267 RepID=UPI002806208E|nr:TonB-dependent receptor [uncultured Fusobacterium sp.]